MAFKMNYNRDSFPYKTDERVKDDLINIRKNERPTEQGKGPTKMDENKGYPKHGHDKGLTKTMENKGYPKVKPDYIDIDGDGNKTESMKNAAASKKGFSKTPYEKNKYSSSMPKHGAGHKMSSADEKRYNNLLNTLNKMNDPMSSNRGKSIVKELKRIKPGFNPEDHTMGQ